ncbi:MAG: hypothetical protein FWE22_08455 [Firmicutes bacterium]|nr:hypothetical protein [Bacillota bacterium]
MLNTSKPQTNKKSSDFCTDCRVDIVDCGGKCKELEFYNWCCPVSDCLFENTSCFDCLKKDTTGKGARLLATLEQKNTTIEQISFF